MLAVLAACRPAVPLATVPVPPVFDPAVNPLEGRWTGIDASGSPGAFEFHADGTVVVSADGRTEGLDGSVRYEFDRDPSPWWLDLVLADGERILLIAELSPAGRLHLGATTEGEAIRSVAFGSAADGIWLDRDGGPPPTGASVLFGPWSGPGGSTYDFRPDGTVGLTGHGDVVEAGWMLDRSHDPWRLDLVVDDATEAGRTRFVAELTPEGHLRMRALVHADGRPSLERPADFEGATDQDTIELVRD